MCTDYECCSKTLSHDHVDRITQDDRIQIDLIKMKQDLSLIKEQLEEIRRMIRTT